jgi:hypothetical protein
MEPRLISVWEWLLDIKCASVRFGVAIVTALFGIGLAEPSIAQVGAQTGASEYQTWLANLLVAHAGHEFCPPQGATVGTVSVALKAYADAHVPSDKQLTDGEWLQMLGALYPCVKPQVLSSDAAKALGSKPLGSVSGNYVVKPTGVYATIDTASISSVLDKLHGPASPELQRTIDAIEHNSGAYAPPVLMQVGISQYLAGNTDDGLFWFHAGILRAILDSKLCADLSVADAPVRLIRRSPPGLIKLAFSDDPRVSNTVQAVVAWDLKTPYAYDHRWIALSGTEATQSALDPAHAPTRVTVAESEWPGIIRKNRAAYPGIVESNAARLKTAQAPTPSRP